MTEAAENDLEEISAYLAEEASEAIAAEFVYGIETACEPVRRFPLSAPPRERLGFGLRVVFYGSYAIYYRPAPDAIVIARILHGKRDVEAIAERGGFLV